MGLGARGLAAARGCDMAGCLLVSAPAFAADELLPLPLLLAALVDCAL